MLLGSALIVATSACQSAELIGLGEVRPGTPVRASYRTGDSTSTSTLIRPVNGSIEVRDPDSANPYRIHLLDLEQLEASKGRALWSGAGIGAAIGGLAGVLVGMVCLASCNGNHGNSRVLAPLIGFGSGAIVGTIPGAIRAPVRWVQVRIR
jgi:hypothetical protein